MCWSKLIDMVMISHKVSDVRHFVGTVVVNHDEFRRLICKRRKQKKAQETIEYVVIHGTRVNHECHNAD